MGSRTYSTHEDEHMQIGERERTQLFPRHEGPSVLPNSPFFTRLLRHAHRKRIAIRDRNLGITKTYGDVLADALAIRSMVERSLSSEVLQSLKRGERVFIGVLAAGGYEFSVAMAAALALGAAVVPMSESNVSTTLCSQLGIKFNREPQPSQIHQKKSLIL